MAIASSSEISKTEYDVFLSFRGPDTRQGFTDVLYDHLNENGIQVFRDDDELSIGDSIDLILEVIKNSKICVPIFSKSFASSAWCLREVAKMVELNKEIVPIFYDVTADDVKLKTSLYVDQMKVHQHAGKANLEEWKKALVDVGRIKGRELNKTGFVEFSKKFKAEISLKLRVKQKYTIKHLVEIPYEVEEALKLLEIDSIDVRFLGLYGMGGVGKTTLAKILFNRISSSFDSCSFLANIREEHSRKGLERLQTKLLHDLSPKAGDTTMNILDNWDDKMERCVRMKSVLIVLDDVGDRSHIRELVGESISFGLRSRVIITTRDERALLMNVADASSSSEGRAKMSCCMTKMEVKGMNPKQAMLLFSRHAFGRDFPLEDYRTLSEDVVSISGGLPLALEVIGSLLYGMSVEAWKDKVTNLKMIPAEDVQEKLMISYNALEDNVKEIFLDIACFFIGRDKLYPFYMWKACGFAPSWSVQVLIAMSLVKITDDGNFWMHDQLRDLGREIVRIKGHSSPTSREGSRIQTYKDVLFVQEKNKEKEVVALYLCESEDGLRNLANFEGLRLLVAGEMILNHRNFWRLPTDLSWLSLALDRPNLTTSIKRMFSTFSQNRNSSYLMKLAILSLSGRAIIDSWEGWILIQELRGLKVLELTECVWLTRTPNFSNMEALERLSFDMGQKLAKIDNSIGKLRKLKHLNLRYCYKLKELPEEVGNLEDLEEIIMTGTRISKLPDSIVKLKNLEHLDLRCSVELEKLPESIGDLRSLVNLDISGSHRLMELPATIGLLEKLKHLNLSYSECLDKLPDSIGDLTSLVSLDMKYCRMIAELPSSITRLEKLERLMLGWCEKLVKLPDELGNLESLVELDLSSTGVAVVPESIGDLAKLQVINLSCATVSVLPETVAQLSLLQKLDLSGCDRIERFPVLPTSLTDLKLNVCSVGQAPDFSKLSQLRVLITPDDDKLGGVESLRQEPSFKFDAMEKLLRLEHLELQLGSQTSVPVEFIAFKRLKSLTLSGSKLTRIPPFPSSLQSLILRDLGRETKLPCLYNLNNLSQLEFERCSMEQLPDLSSLLKSLRKLKLSYCKELVEIPGLGTLVSLTNLYISNCDSLKRLENIKNLTRLRYVTVYGCKNFRGLQGCKDLRQSQQVFIIIYKCKCKDSSH